jgi:hypothetical protein
VDLYQPFELHNSSYTPLPARHYLDTAQIIFEHTINPTKMPIHTLEGMKRPKAGNPSIGRRFTDWRPKVYHHHPYSPCITNVYIKPAPPKNRPTETNMSTTRKPAKKKRKISAKRPAKIATSEDHDNDDGDDYYVPSEYDQDSDSDASSIMSVDAKEMGDGVQEKLGRDGKVIRSRGPVKDYALVEEAVVSDESWKNSGAYHRQQFKALLAEQVCLPIRRHEHD